MASKTRIKIKLESTAGTGHCYTTVICPRNEAAKNNGKLELLKFDPIIRKHVLYKEKKIK